MLRNYEAFLTRKGTVKPQYIPYYLKWISDCYNFLHEPLSNRLGIEQKGIEGFGNDLWIQSHSGE